MRLPLQGDRSKLMHAPIRCRYNESRKELFKTRSLSQARIQRTSEPFLAKSSVTPYFCNSPLTPQMNRLGGAFLSAFQA